MTSFNFNIPSSDFKDSDSLSTLSKNMDIQIICPKELGFISTVTLKFVDTSPHPSPQSKDKHMQHFYDLYGESWIKVKTNNNYKYKCVQCGKLFKVLRGLFTHISIHRNERLYPCQYCSLKYFAPKSLRLHISKFHKDKVDYLYFCTYCDKGYMVESAFLRHLESEVAKKDIIIYPK